MSVGGDSRLARPNSDLLYFNQDRLIKLFVWSNLTKDPDQEVAAWQVLPDEVEGDEDEDPPAKGEDEEEVVIPILASVTVAKPMRTADVALRMVSLPLDPFSEARTLAVKLDAGEPEEPEIVLEVPSVEDPGYLVEGEEGDGAATPGGEAAPVTGAAGAAGEGEAVPAADGAAAPTADGDAATAAEGDTPAAGEWDAVPAEGEAAEGADAAGADDGLGARASANKDKVRLKGMPTTAQTHRADDRHEPEWKVEEPERAECQPEREDANRADHTGHPERVEGQHQRPPHEDEQQPH